MANTFWNSADQTGITLSGSNLIATANLGTGAAVRAVDAQNTGKFYWETTNNVGTVAQTGTGIASSIATPLANLGNASLTSVTGFCIYYHNNTIYRSGTSLGLTPGAVTNGSVICHALDLTNRLYWVRLGAAGNWNGSAANNPATGMGGIDISSFSGGAFWTYPVVSAGATSDQWTANFGDSAFTGTVPSGFTSGFPAGASIPRNAIVTQASAEHWVAVTAPAAAVTQALVEHWGTVNAISTQAVVTQVAVEHWALAAQTAKPRRVVCVSG